MIINLTGQAGAGKTTIAKELLKLIPNSINIDGDELREIFKNKDYSEVGRRNNITRAYDIALFLDQQGYYPIISLMSPYKDLRDGLKEKTLTLEYYIVANEIRGRENFWAENFEPPTEDFSLIDTKGRDAKDVAKEMSALILSNTRKIISK